MDSLIMFKKSQNNQMEVGFIEIQVKPNEVRPEYPFTLSMAECIPTDLYFAISRVDDLKEYPKSYFDPYNLSLYDCLGCHELYLAIPRGTIDGDQCNSHAKSIGSEERKIVEKKCVERGRAEEEDVDEEEEENFWYGWYNIHKFKRTKERARASCIKIKKSIW